VYDKKYLIRATSLFENMLSYGNHLCMFSEEIARSGEQLGNTPQAFSHLALISKRRFLFSLLVFGANFSIGAAFNLDRVTSGSSSV